MECLTWTEFEAILDECLVTAAALTSQNLSTSISLVHKEWMTDMLHVGTNLMGTARFQHTLHQGGITETFQHLVMSNRRLAYSAVRIEDLHTEAVFRITADIAFYATFIFYNVAPNERIVTAMGSLVEELLTQCGLCRRSLCHNEQSAGIFINAMHQAHFRIIGIKLRHIS